MFKKNSPEEESFQPTPTQARPAPPSAPSGRTAAVIGRSIVVKGEVSGQEDLQVEGRVEGRIVLPEQQVVVGPTGRVEAEVEAKVIIVEGTVVGNVKAAEKVIITQEGSLTGDIEAARLSVEDGAYLKGTVELTPREKPKTVTLNRAPSEAKPKVETKPGLGPDSGKEAIK